MIRLIKDRTQQSASSSCRGHFKPLVYIPDKTYLKKRIADISMEKYNVKFQESNLVSWVYWLFLIGKTLILKSL